MVVFGVDVSVLPKDQSQESGPAGPTVPSLTWHEARAVNIRWPWLSTVPIWCSPQQRTESMFAQVELLSPQ